jgi:hypothetical protein
MWNKISISWGIFGKRMLSAGPHSSKYVGITFSLVMNGLVLSRSNGKGLFILYQ